MKTHVSGRAVARVAAVLLLLVAACGSDRYATERSATAAPPPTDAAGMDAAATDAGRRFLDRYLADDGRIVRRDQGGDTISEGQAYGMLIAVALDDRSTFDRIWSWTREHLQRDDGLLAWRWQDGAVTDPMPATDADVDAAHALALAASTFRSPTYAGAATAMAESIVAHEVIAGERGPVAVAGPWAVEQRWVNPSYGDPVAFAALAELTGDETWASLDDAARRIAIQSATVTDLPPDWAVLTTDAIEARGAPSGGSPGHGYDAARVAIRFAIDCDPGGREIAASMVDEYQQAAGDNHRPPAVLDLSGAPRADHGHPVMTVAHAASLQADDRRSDAATVLFTAEAQSMDHPSYYGDAWVALGRLWLTTERLGGCAAA